MIEAEYQALVERLGENDRAILAEAKRLGTATVSELRPVTRGPKTGKPMEYGLTRELTRLQEAGLLRQVGKVPARYAAVPASEVEGAAERFALKKKRTKKRRSNRSRVAELRTYEHGDYSEFYRVHRRVIELSEYVSHHLTRMAYWAAAPKDDLARVVQELANLREAMDEAVACLRERADDDDLLAKIAKLEATEGRTDEEAETYRALARKLRRQYEQRVGVLD